MHASVPVALAGALMFSLAWGWSQHATVGELRGELARAGTVIERQRTEVRDLAARVDTLEEQWHTLEVVHKAVEFAPIPPPEPAAPAPQSSEPRTARTEPVANAPGPAFLNINSSPPSTCLLDGQVLGMTPRARVPVTPGKHTVQFVGTDAAATVAVVVAPGETKAAVARLASPGVASGMPAQVPDGF